VQVVDVDNGSRFETYVIPGTPDSGVIQVNGAAARLVQVGDTVIIMSFAQVESPPPADWSPAVVFVDERNRVSDVRHAEPADAC
jgi:aspartate 1-decarboxylase